jgi:hypothetical protein
MVSANIGNIRGKAANLARQGHSTGAEGDGNRRFSSGPCQVVNFVSAVVDHSPAKHLSPGQLFCLCADGRGKGGGR